MTWDALTARIDGERICAKTLDFVRIPSPSGNEEAAAEFYAETLREIGVRDVVIDREIPASPSVIARIKGAGNGPTLQFDGHIDTIDKPGPDPAYRDGYVYGRGTEDMKGDMVCVAEALRVLLSSGLRLPGDLLITAHGLHESGTNESLKALIRRKVHGDAVVVAEGYTDRLPVAGLGLGIWKLEFESTTGGRHENETKPGTPNPLLAGLRAADLLRRRMAALSKKELEYVGPESIFIGKFQAGDYFNRTPARCLLEGSRRFGPDRSLRKVEREFERLAARIGAETGVHARGMLTGGLESFRVDPAERIVRATRSAHTGIWGRDLPFVGMRTAGNLSNFVREAGIPGVYYGISLSTAHSDNERIHLDEAVAVAKVFLNIMRTFYEES